MCKDDKRFLFILFVQLSWGKVARKLVRLTCRLHTTRVLVLPFVWWTYVCFTSMVRTQVLLYQKNFYGGHIWNYNYCRIILILRACESSGTPTTSKSIRETCDSHFKRSFIVRCTSSTWIQFPCQKVHLRHRRLTKNRSTCTIAKDALGLNLSRFLF